MKRAFAICLTLLCCCASFIFSVCATNTSSNISGTVVSVTRVDLPDGGYILEEISQIPTSTRASGSKSGQKTSTRYGANGSAIYAVEVVGSFNYNGSYAKATSASATVYIYDSGVSYVSKSSNYSSNFATATGNIKYYGDPESRTVTLYCDKDGNLS